MPTCETTTHASSVGLVPQEHIERCRRAIAELEAVQSATRELVLRHRRSSHEEDPAHLALMNASLYQALFELNELEQSFRNPERAPDLLLAFRSWHRHRDRAVRAYNAEAR